MAKVAILLGDEFEDSEFRKPYDALREAGHEVTVLGPEEDETLAGKRGKEHITPDAAIADADPERFDALVIPGGHAPDHLRIHEPAVSFVRRFAATNRPVAAICHGPQLLIEAGLVRGRRMTSWPSVRTDLRNAGAQWVDEAVVEDGCFITSRNPDDLDRFDAAVCARLH